MADQREGGIDWTDQTWNPVRGCSRVSPGCENCYAERVAARFSGPGQPYEGLARIGRAIPSGESRPRWTGEVRIVPEHLADPLRWRRPRRIFVNSMSDLFHEKLTNEEIAAVFGVMAAAPHHTFQVLTKRPERMRDWFRWVQQEQEDPISTCGREVVSWIGDEFHAGWRGWDRQSQTWPLPNVWLGVTAEDQQRADERIPLLLETPAAKRFVSVEPQLGLVDLDAIQIPGEREGLRFSALQRQHDDRFGASDVTLDWVIQGCESGHGARPFNVAWARSMRDQCQAAGVAYFYKQGPALPFDLYGLRPRRGEVDKAPEIDGRTWKEFPK